tara:strand:- start:1214 stop:1522 length:309 start_codon:yes stop_codon:yes gene_type:complete
MEQTAVLNISKENLKCSEVAKLLQKHNIMCNIIQNNSVRKDVFENGCRITIGNTSKEQIENTWDVLKNKFNLTCAHLQIHANYEGCILDYVSPKLCPGFNDV